jgi:glycosyltransferase involved in cell wall biosynthesis
MTVTTPSPTRSLSGPRIAIFDNLANSAYIQAKVLRRIGQPVDVVLDPMDRYVMSDPRWDELDLELPSDQLADPTLPDCEMPDWIKRQPGTYASRPFANAGVAKYALGTLGRFLALGSAGRRSLREAGWRGAWLASQRSWVLHTLASYDCVIAYGMGPVWAALAGVPCLAQTWGGDITMAPFYDTGDWENHERVPLPGPRAELFAQAKLQRFGYRHAARVLLTDPRFMPYARRLGLEKKSLHLGFVIDTQRYVPAPAPELRRGLLRDSDDGLVVFVPARQDWEWKGSDRLLRGFAKVARIHPQAVLVCAGWGADIERSRRLIDELGIRERVRLLPCAMSKARLLRYYQAADVVADQFTVGSYGGSALEAMSCARPLLISLDEDRFRPVFDSLPPVMNVSNAEQIASALDRLLGDPLLRARLGEQARAWVVENHGPALAKRTIELCEEVLAEAPPAVASHDTEARAFR